MKTINDYAELVKEKHALNKTIAPVETDLTDASRGYHIGEQFINDGDLFKAKTEIAQHDALVLNTNYEPADDLTTQIKNAGGGTGTDPRLDVFENNIAPVETDETDASRAYQVGEQLILNNILYDVIAAISVHDVITTTGSGANIEPADPLSSQFQTLTNKLNNEIVTRSALGAKNILPFDLAAIKANNTTGTWADNVYTLNGVDFTFNTDGSVLVDGTATANAEVDYILNLAISGDFILSDELAGIANNYWAFAMVDDDSANLKILTDTEMPVTIASKMNYFRIKVFSGKTVSNITFKPMLRLATDANSDYQPYSQTNKELTAKINEVNSSLGNKASTTDVNNKHKLTIKTVSTSGWTSDTTSQSGITLYKKSISLTNVYVPSPTVSIGTSSGTGLPTAAQQTAYDLVQYATVDGTTLYLYASAIPSSTFYIQIEGVD